MFDNDALPDISWSQMEDIYRQGHANWVAAKRSVLQQLYGSRFFRHTTNLKDELLAHLRWSTRILRADTRVPMPVEWDSRHIVALLELARVLNDQTYSAGSDAASFTLPPVTAATCLVQLLVFMKPGGVLLKDVSLSPYCVIDRKEYYRLWSAALVHVDATHLITNLTAVLPDCVMLEKACGSAALAADMLLLTTTSSLLYVAFAWLQKIVFIKRSNYYSLVTVGFSGVVFGLKVWSGFKRGGVVYMWGVPFPARFSWVPALALTHLCVPEASFPAHIAGVVAGLLRAYAMEPVIRALNHGISWSQKRSVRRGGHFLHPPAGSQDSSNTREDHKLQPACSGSSQQQLEQRHDWRHLHHSRWLQQQSDAASSSSNNAGSSPSSKQLSSSRGAGNSTAVADPRPAEHTGTRPSSTCTSSPGGMPLRALLLDVGLQLGLAAAAAGLYFLLSSKQALAGSYSGRSKTSLWTR